MPNHITFLSLNYFEILLFYIIFKINLKIYSAVVIQFKYSFWDN
jgi:hypothetical protein